MRCEARTRFASAYNLARNWLEQLLADANVSVANIVAREERSERSVRQVLSLAFLDPLLVSAAMEGTLPRGLGVKRLIDLPPPWREQWRTLGLQAPARV